LAEEDKMDIALADLIKTISMEAIKIIGPASIATYATYKATKVQYELKLKEIEHNHEFAAKQVLFDYYKSRQTKMSESYNQLSSTLGTAMGAAAAIEEHRKEGEAPSKVIAVVDIVNSYVALAPFDLSITARDYKVNDMESSEEYQKITEYTKRVEGLQTSTQFEIVRGNVVLLLELYSFLERCNQSLIERQMEKLFSKYCK
jgi:hypothetical protein